MKFILFILGILAVIASFFLSVREFDAYNIKRKCEIFNEVSGYETKFIEYTHFNYECISKVNDKWIPTDNIRDLD